MKRIYILSFIMLVATSFKPRETTWLAIGDSITYLNDHLDETGNRVTKGYLTNVTAHFKNLRFVNKGFNGLTSGNFADHIDSLGISKADIYTIFLGTNDWGQGRPIGNITDYKENKGNVSFYGSYRVIVDKIRRLNPSAKIVMISPMQRQDFVYIGDATNNAKGSYRTQNGQYLEQFANAVDSIGAYENIPVIDLYHKSDLDLKGMVKFKRLKEPKTGVYRNYKYPDYINIPFDPKTDEYPYPPAAMNLTYDGLHPSDKGNKIIANYIAEVFKGYLN